MKVLITGGAGGLATALKERLLKGGFRAAAFDRAALDITEREKVFAAVKRERPDVVINAAAYTKVDKAETEKAAAFAVNRYGAGNVAEAAGAVNSFIIHISTDFVFDGRKSTPYTETDRTNPLSVYGESKLKGEDSVAGANPRHMIVRTSWLYGSAGSNFVKTILNLARERDALRVVFDQTGTPTHTEDLAGALVKAVEALKAGSLESGIYHYSNEGVASWYDFAYEVICGARETGMTLKCREIVPILTEDYPTPASRPPYSVLDKSKIKNALGITIPHWKASLKEAIKTIAGGLDA